MLSLGIYTFATTCYGFIISVKESRGLLTVMAVLLSIAFLGQLASVFTAMMLRTDLETEIANVGNVVSDMKKYDSEDGYTKANWDSLHNESAHEIPEDQYRGIMTSGLLPNNFIYEAQIWGVP